MEGKQEMKRKQKCQEVILFERGVKQNALYVHHLLAASGHDAQCMVCACVKLKLIVL